MTQKFYDQMHILLQLLYRDFYIFRQHFLHRLKMASCWVLLSTFVTKMFLPSMGLDNFGPFILISSTICYGLFTSMQNAMTLVEDITGDQAILYELTLPTPAWMIFFKFAISNMLQGLAISLSLLPLGLLILMNPCPFPYFSWIHFITIFLCANIFYGGFSLILAAYLNNMSQVENVWLRILFPIWYLGCYQFPWHALHKISPYLAYANLCNPMTLICEAARSATIDPVGALPFWPSCLAILIFAAGFYILGIHWMKKRLDCI